MVKLLLDKGAEFRIGTFMYVGRAAELDFLQAVIELTGKKRQAALDVALIGAAQESSVEVVDWLLQQGANPSPALVQAAYSENTTPDFVRKFLECRGRTRPPGTRNQQFQIPARNGATSTLTPKW